VWLKPQHQQIVGTYLAEIRHDAAVKQDELAVRIGRPQSFISGYERGQRRLDLLEFLVIVDALNVDLSSAMAAIVKRAHPLLEEHRKSRKTKKKG
jgi:transcriptional regulator with XRE-family HTH domain